MKQGPAILFAICCLTTATLRAEQFDSWDRNKDGKLAREELPEPLRKNFERIDSNHDGFISREEDAAARNNRGGGNPQQALPDTVKATLDIPYADTQSPAQRLDLYLPAKRDNDKALPVIVFIHGGGWQAGSKAGGRASVLPYVTSGQYAGASVEYRLSNVAKRQRRSKTAKPPSAGSRPTRKRTASTLKRSPSGAQVLEVTSSPCLA